MQDELVEGGPDVEPEVFGAEPDPDDPALNADADDVHGSHDHPADA